LLTGANTLYWSRLYRNDGEDRFPEVAGFSGVMDGGVAWGDWDNDADLDLLLTGNWLGQGPVTRFHRNEGALGFVDAAMGPVPPGVMESWVAWGDYDKNVGTTPGGTEILTPMSHADGYRKLPALGNVNHNTRWSLDLPGEGPIYWSVQAVDGGFVGSAFAEEVCDSVGTTSVPSREAWSRDVVFCSVTPNPFREGTVLDFTLARAAEVEVGVYDAAGRLVRGLLHEDVAAGEHCRVRWDGRDGAGTPVASGIYFGRLHAGRDVVTRKLVLAR
jgi:FlgD Ig-like domain